MSSSSVPFEAATFSCSPHLSSPFTRRFTGHLSEGGGEGSLGGVAERGCDRDDRRVGIAQHVHGLLEPVLAQPGMRRKSGAFLESAAEVEARQAGLRSQRTKRDVGI